MTQHLNLEPCFPPRVVILGGSGFVGRYLQDHLRLQGVAAIGVGSKEVDLTDPSSASKLKGLWTKDDAVVFASCLTPDRGKDIRTTMKNLAMGEHVAEVLQTNGCAQFIYISSDAVYADSETLVREDSRCEPSTLYGLGHFLRERMIRISAEASKTPWLIVRPTLLYGVGDPHGSYGPNRFMKQIAENGTIKIFGHGEEQRDHVQIEDVARFLGQCLSQRTIGMLNLASGVSTSFLKVAELCVKSSPRPATIERLPRSGPITHRHFDITATRRAFPLFRFTSVADGVDQSYAKKAAA